MIGPKSGWGSIHMKIGDSLLPKKRYFLPLYAPFGEFAIWLIMFSVMINGYMVVYGFGTL